MGSTMPVGNANAFPSTSFGWLCPRPISFLTPTDYTIVGVAECRAIRVPLVRPGPTTFFQGSGLASCPRTNRRVLGYLHCPGLWSPLFYHERLGALLYCCLTRLFHQDRVFFLPRPQTIFFTLQMFIAILQFPYMSCLLLQFLLHVLKLVKKLIFGRLDHRVASHCTCVKRIRCGEGNHQCYWWRRATR